MIGKPTDKPTEKAADKAADKATPPRQLKPNAPPLVYEPMEGPKLRPLKGPRRSPIQEPLPLPAPVPPPRRMPVQEPMAAPPPKRKPLPSADSLPPPLPPLPKSTTTAPPSARARSPLPPLPPPPPLAKPATTTTTAALAKNTTARTVHVVEALPRVVVFTRDDPRHSTGGVETFTQRLLEVFPRSEVVAYSGAAGSRLLLNEARDARAARSQLARAVTLLRPAAIVANGAAAWALRNGKTPIVTVFHGTYAGLGEAMAPLAPRRGLIARTYGAFMERRATRGRAAIVAVSRKAADEVRALYGVRASIRIIENGGKPDPRPLPPKWEARHELGIADAARVALFVGRAEASKGYGEVVALAKARPDVTVLAAGVAPDAGLPENLHAQGVVGADVMARLLAATDVVVLPSRYEGCSIALIDALMGDRPIVTTATGSFDTVGDHPFGVVVPRSPGSLLAADFIEAVDSVLAAPQRFKPLAACKERFSFVRFAREWRALLRELTTHAP